MTRTAAAEIGHILLEVLCDPYLNKSLIESTIANNPDFTVRNRREETPMLMAADMGNNDALILMIAAGAPVDDAMPNGNTALMISVIHGNTRGVDILMEAGADVTIKNTLGHDVFDFAKLYDQHHLDARITAQLEKRHAQEMRKKAEENFNENAQKGFPLTEAVHIQRRVKRGPKP